MKITESGVMKHRQLQFEDYMKMVTGKQREHAGVCKPLEMVGTDISKFCNRRMTEWYVRWCGRTVGELIAHLLPN